MAHFLIVDICPGLSRHLNEWFVLWLHICLHMSSHSPHINIPIVVQFKQNASRTKCMFKLSQIQSPCKPTFFSPNIRPYLNINAPSLTLLFMHQRASFSLSSTVGRILFSWLFSLPPLILICTTISSASNLSLSGTRIKPVCTVNLTLQSCYRVAMFPPFNGLLGQ